MDQQSQERKYIIDTDIKLQSAPCTRCGKCYSIATILKSIHAECGRCLNKRRQEVAYQEEMADFIVDMIVDDNDEKYNDEVDELFIVERILCHDPEERLWLVKWEGYPVREATWEPYENLCMNTIFMEYILM